MSMNPTFEDVLLARRRFIAGGMGLAAFAAFPGCAAQGTRPVIGFTPVASGTAITTLVIQSTDADQPGVYVQIEGEGTTQGEECATTP